MTVPTSSTSSASSSTPVDIVEGRSYAIKINSTPGITDSAELDPPFALYVTKKAKPNSNKSSGTKVHFWIVGTYTGRKIPNPVLLTTFKRWITREVSL